MKKWFLGALFAAVFITNTGIGIAADLSFEAGLRVNHETLDGNFDTTIPAGIGSIITGVGGTYNDEEFKYWNAKFAVKNSNFTPGLKYLLGFKGLYGEAYDNKRGGSNKDSDFAVLGFLLGADYEIPAKMNPVPIPITTGFSLIAAPKPLCFQDTDTYFEIGMGFKFHIINNAMITFDYRFADMEFEEDGGYEWDKEHHMFLVGYTIKF